MSDLGEREGGFEAKFASDEAREFRAIAKRNRMLGEWAAGLMGLENVADYASAVVKADFEQPGDEDVLRKIHQDLTGAGLSVPQGEIRARMDEFLAITRGHEMNGK